jgi:hypothetical protein
MLRASARFRLAIQSHVKQALGREAMSGGRDDLAAVSRKPVLDRAIGQCMGLPALGVGH